MPLDPLPIDAHIHSFNTIADVRFDRPLVTAVGLNVGNWVVIFAGFVYPVLTAETQGDIVRLGLGGGDPTLDPAKVDFTPPPFDVVSVEGGHAAGFLGFPIHA